MSAQFPFPPRSGFETRVYQLARELASRHDVTLLSYVDPGRRYDVARLREHLSVEVVEREAVSRGAKRMSQLVSVASRRPFAFRSVYSPEMQKAIDEICSTRSIDIILVESSVLGAFRFPAAPRLVLDEHNIEYEVFARMHASERSLPRRLFNRLEHTRFRRLERTWWRQVDGCAVTSEREAAIVRSHAPKTALAVVPNGVDLEYFSPRETKPDPLSVVFNGVLDYRPNLDAAHFLVDEIWPLVLQRLPDAQLSIVGRGEPADLRSLERPGIVATGQVPDLRPYLANAAVVAVPIRMGGKARLKVVEGLAMAKAMVSTSIGCEGVDVRDGEHLLVANSPEAFAAAVVGLLQDRTLAHALGRAGRAQMEQRYSWELAAGRMEELFRCVPSESYAAVQVKFAPAALR